MSAPVDEWSTLLGEDEPITQASGLPNPGTFQLYKLDEVLKTKDDFEIWFNQISLHLKSNNLHRLIDRKIPRPSKSNLDIARKWQQISLQITGYLVANMSFTLVQQVRAQGVRVELADEFMEQAIKLFWGRGLDTINKNIAFWSLVETKMSDFGTTVDFIRAIYQRYLAANELGIVGAPYIAATTLFRQLDKEEPFCHVLAPYYRLLEGQDDPSIGLNAKDFYECCSEILQYIEQSAENSLI